MRYGWLGCLAALLAISCGSGPRTVGLDELERKEVGLPNGQKVQAQVVIKPFDLLRGLMFRDRLPRGEGMLFVHPKPDKYPYRAYQVQIPLDIVWMNANREIVEISANAPPCHDKASACPTYGGKHQSLFELEIGAGEAERNRLQVGQTLSF